MLSGVVVASAATLSVDGGTLQVFRSPAEIELPPTLRFLVPSAVDLTIAGADGPGRQIITMGGPVGTTGGGACSELEALPVQSAVVTDPSAQGANLLLSQLVPLQEHPLDPGTRLINVLMIDQCLIGDVEYTRYRADIG
jgi:hypothetical protein